MSLRVIVSQLMLCVLLVCPVAWADSAPERFRDTDYPLPRFVSLKSDKVYVRAGPSTNYPIEWVFRREGLPVEIIQEFETWRKIRDHEGQTGWVHKLLLSGKRTVLTRTEGDEKRIAMHEGFADTSRIVAYVEPMVVAELDKCVEQWCRLQAGLYRGWVERKFLFGIYETEEFN